MEENLILEPSVSSNISENVSDQCIDTDTNVNERKGKMQYKESKNKYKEKECKVIAYNHFNGTLDIKFDKFGIRIKNVKDFSGDTVMLKYKGEIGKPNFEFKL